MYTPLNFENINLYEGLISPSEIKNRNNKSYDYWFRQLYLRLKGNLEFNFNDIIDSKACDFIIAIMLIKGFVGFAEDKEIGLFGQICTPKAYNFYYQPKKFIVTNPYWGKINNSKTYTCGVDGVIVRALPDYSGFYDIISYYAEKLALLDESLNTSLINSKVPHIIGAKTKGAIKALQAIFDKVNAGNPAAFYNSRLADTAEGTEPFQFIELFNKNKYITDLLLADRQTILHDFDTEIGIKSIPYNKKERLSTDEVNIKEDEGNTKLNACIDTINADFQEVNKLFGVDFSVCKNEKTEIDSQEEGGEVDEIDNDITGSL